MTHWRSIRKETSGPASGAQPPDRSRIGTTQYIHADQNIIPFLPRESRAQAAPSNLGAASQPASFIQALIDGAALAVGLLFIVALASSVPLAILVMILAT